MSVIEENSTTLDFVLLPIPELIGEIEESGLKQIVGGAGGQTPDSFNRLKFLG